MQVPAPGDALPAAGDAPAQARLDRALAILRATPWVESARALSAAELTDLLRPWLGNGGGEAALPLPAVVQVHLRGAGGDTAALQSRLEAAVPGTLVESHGEWVRRLSVLARSLQACAWLALAVVTAVAAAVITIATRAGLSARRDSIGIVHGLGATDGYIAGRFAGRATTLTAIGAIGGALAAVPVLLALATIAAPFVAASGAAAPAPALDLATASALARTLPTELWLGLPALPLAAAFIGFLTAQGTVRSWLRRLP